MERAYQTPGVYKVDITPKAAPQLQTGVPGFIGFVNSESAGDFKDPLLLHDKVEFDNQVQGHLAAGSYLDEAVNGFFLNGGARCYVVCAGFAAGGDSETNKQAIEEALEKLSPLTDLDLVAAPDAMMLRSKDESLDVQAIRRVQIQILKHCDLHGNRFAILDALAGKADEVIEQRNDITRELHEPINGAIYYPWLVLPGSPKSPSGDKKIVPPSGHIAGIFARSDAAVGVFKAPANEEVLGVLDLGVEEAGRMTEVRLDDRLQGRLNPEGINCLRAFPGRGIRVWGARSLNRDPAWRYVNVCRLVVTLRRWIEMNMKWVTFEPNNPQLWIRIARELNVYLTDLWRAGALSGQTQEEAFYIKCDIETNPRQAIEGGQVVTEIGLAPGAPAEFVIVRVVHQIGVEPR